MTTGDTGGAPRRTSKPPMTGAQQQQLVPAIEKVRLAHNAGRSTNDLSENMAGSIWDIRELIGATSDAVDFVTTLVVHGSMQLDLATFLGISPAKQQTLQDVLAIQATSGLKTLNISPKACETLVRGLSRELVTKIDGTDYSAPAKTQQTAPPTFTTAQEILAFMNRKPEKPVQQTGPVSRVWSYATHYSKTIHDLLNLLPESLGKTSSTGTGRPKDKDETTGGRPKDKDEVTGTKGGTARPKDKDEVTKGGTARPKDKDEGDGKAPKKLTKTQVRKHIEGINGAADAALKAQILDGLKGDKSVEWAVEMLAEAGLPTP